MARINHEVALDVLRDKLAELKKIQKDYVKGTWRRSYEMEISSLENTIFTLELDQEQITFR